MHSSYENTKNYNEASAAVRKLLQQKYRLKMVITYDSKMAKKLKNKLAKNFFIAKESRGK
jgi:hypothetical protein